LPVDIRQSSAAPMPGRRSAEARGNIINGRIDGFTYTVTEDWHRSTRPSRTNRALCFDAADASAIILKGRGETAVLFDPRWTFSPMVPLRRPVA
jgi:hypothetical protein